MVHFIYDSMTKHDDFDFPIINFPYLSGNIPQFPAYGVFVSQLIRYAQVCSKYEDFLFRGSISPEVHWVKRTQHERKRSIPNRMLCTFYPWR